jgi:hypothetical protein
LRNGHRPVRNPASPVFSRRTGTDQDGPQWVDGLHAFPGEPYGSVSASNRGVQGRGPLGLQYVDTRRSLASLVGDGRAVCASPERARISTEGQTLDAQIATLKAAGAARIYRETASGAKAERKELARALKAISAGDTLLVTRLDRLARSTRDLPNIVNAIAKAGAGIRSLADAWADTTAPHGRLM